MRSSQIEAADIKFTVLLYFVKKPRDNI